MRCHRSTIRHDPKGWAKQRKPPARAFHRLACGVTYAIDSSGVPRSAPASGTRTIEPPTPDPQRFERRHELVHRVLRANIVKGHLPAGLVLLEAPLASLLRTSRAPVQRALLRLEQDDLVHRHGGRGFVVGRPAAREPLRTDLRRLGLVVTDEMDEALQTRGSWERVAADLEAAVLSCLVFGEFRIVEAEAAQHFKVSRTVIRDALGRLQERGLLRKTRTSRWIAGPLTAHSLRDCYDLRRILEPAAIEAVAPSLDRVSLAALRDRIDAATAAGAAGAGAADLFARFGDLCVLAAPNGALVAVIRQNALLLDAATRSLARLGLPHDEAPVRELRVTIDLLLNGSVAAAAAWWRDHLAAACQRSIAQLKIVAVIDRPATIPPYLAAV